VRRQRLLLLITVLTPLLLLGLAEIALRLAGIGQREPLFVPVASAPGYLQPNSAAIQRFFPDPRRAPNVAIDTTWFPARKAPGTLHLRQGESSAAGFPYGRWASPGALLQQRLQRAYPDRNVEVISTAMAAVTSYVLLDFADEIIPRHPDAVVIYTGHNEYLGVGGGGLVLRQREVADARARRGGVAAPAPVSGARAAGVVGWRRPGADVERRGHADVARGARALDPARFAALPAGGSNSSAAISTGCCRNTARPAWRCSSARSRATSATSRRSRAARMRRTVRRRSSVTRTRRRLDAEGKYDEARTEYLVAKDRDELRFARPSLSTR
jgi:hypothetical protein